MKDVLELHPWTGEPYYLGVFLVGAYQEILGDLHNLFGDTDAVHVTLDEDGGYTVEHVVEGDAVEEVLAYVQYDAPRADREGAAHHREARCASGEISIEESARLRRALRAGPRRVHLPLARRA